MLYLITFSAFISLPSSFSFAPGTLSFWPCSCLTCHDMGAATKDKSPAWQVTAQRDETRQLTCACAWHPPAQSALCPTPDLACSSAAPHLIASLVQQSTIVCTHARSDALTQQAQQAQSRRLTLAAQQQTQREPLLTRASKNLAPLHDGRRLLHRCDQQER